jgi:hypothetical protein
MIDMAAGMRSFCAAASNGLCTHPAILSLASRIADLSGQWIDLVHGRRSPRGIVLDMDLSVSPSHGEQEMSVWNGHYAITWLQGDGLAEFDGEAARGEISSADGRVVWTRSHLQTREQAERDERVKGHRFLARLGITLKLRR